MPSPAFVSISTSWPARTSSAALSGVRPTRYSRVLISFGQPTRISISSDLARKYLKFGAFSWIFCYASAKQSLVSVMERHMAGEFPVQLDEFDQKILGALERDGMLTAAALSERIGLSP